MAGKCTRGPHSVPCISDSDGSYVRVDLAASSVEAALECERKIAWTFTWD